MDDDQINKLTEAFKKELINSAMRQPRFQEIVKSCLPYVKMKTNDGFTYHFQMVVPSKCQVSIPLSDFICGPPEFFRHLADRALDCMSNSFFKMGMQTNPIEEKDRHLVLSYLRTEYTPMGGARETITIPIAVHPSVQRGQIVMHPEDYANLLRDTHSVQGSYGRLLTEITVTRP